MRRAVNGFVAVLVLAGGLSAFGGTLKKVKDWADGAGAGKVASELTRLGLTNAADRAAVSAAWDEDVLVDTAVARKAYGLAAWAMGMEKLSSANRGKVKTAVLGDTVAPAMVLGVVEKLPVAERQEFEAAVEKATPQWFPGAEFAKFNTKYRFMQGVGLYSEGVSEADAIRVLLAPEPLRLQDATQFKKLLKDRAVALAAKKLRAEGKSFVVKDGQNPLVPLVEPVVTALNAPECAGLEASLRALGLDVADVPRDDLRTKGTEWRAEIDAGKLAMPAAVRVLGKFSVALGPEAYNKYVDEYNNGRGQ